MLIVALTGSWAVLFARGIGEGLRTERGFLAPRVSSARADEYPTVLRSDAAELQTGDKLLALDGRDLRGSTAFDFYDQGVRGARERGSVRVLAERAGTPFQVELALMPRPGWWLMFAVLFGFMAVAVVLVLAAPSSHLVRLVFATLWSWAMAGAVMDWLDGPLSTGFEVTLAGSFLGVAAALSVWTAQEFTPSARPVPALLRAVAIAAGVLAASNFFVRAFLPFTRSQNTPIVVATDGPVVVALLAGLIRAYSRSAPLERRQIRWLVLGYGVAFVGGLVAILINLIPAHLPARILLSLAALAIPTGLLVSVIGYHWLDVDRLISAAASYTIVGIAFLGVALALVPRVSNAAAPALGIDPALGQWLLNMALVVAVTPALLYLRPRLDRGMFAERHQRMSGLARLCSEVTRCGSARELAELTGERVDALLEPASIALFQRNGSVFTPEFVRGRSPPPVCDADSLLVRALARRGQPLSAGSAELDPFDRAALETVGVALLVPACTREGVTAFACLGPKRSGDIYTREEIAALAAVAESCSAVLLRLDSRETGKPVQIFRREGDLWTIASRGKQIHLRDMRGLHYLATLLREPRREFAALDLVRATSGVVPGEGSRPDPESRVVRRLGDAGPVLDAQARNDYRARLAEVEAERSDAERCADLGRLERASAEREALLAELESVGRSAKPGSDTERARIAVTKAIRTAFEKITEAHPELGAHLAGSIRRGLTCAYEPDPRELAEWEV